MSVSLGKRVFVLAAITMAAAVSLSPQTAQAAAREDCPRGAICTWQLSGFQGKITSLRPGSGCVNVPGRFSSIFNNNGFGSLASGTVFAGPNCTGTVIDVISAGEASTALRAPGSSVLLAV